ncbi:hypothetical protein BN59_02719 [Legionella massiliensis]|uniref:DUF4189 domain-containing protein n=1 Tax=Legionella massiliensis TaxID=1034943 RepID=A0A078L2S6_9GAMM|nr:hypothetical protein [Legionella massiliensis]CDZ78409.1 hypothetical protein BN59_02719 [Legionella massiliensis]CEE14147.1 hypothetical protein BN1094_02719 [Legionella massiliensis]
MTNRKLGTVFFFIAYLSSQLSLASTDGLASGNFWRCSTSDAEQKEWTVDSSYEISAINKSYDDCKKLSNVPTSCKSSKEACEMFLNGLTTRPMWRCTALDQMAKVWASNIYKHRDDAAIAAKAFCQQGSSFPDTCYINLMTCKNLNSRE